MSNIEENSLAKSFSGANLAFNKIHAIHEIGAGKVTLIHIEDQGFPIYGGVTAEDILKEHPYPEHVSVTKTFFGGTPFGEKPLHYKYNTSSGALEQVPEKPLKPRRTFETLTAGP
ncbi:MAG: hypothetical protein ACT4OY_09085 [Alphaproteobacteria bacterium]